MGKRQPQISFVEKLGYGSGDMASNFLFHAWNLFLSFFYTDVFGLPPAAVASMFLWTRLLDMITDPTMGVIADRTNSRLGKYRPYVLFGSIPFGIFGYLMFIAPEWGIHAKLIYAYVSYSLSMLAYTIVQIPYSALMGVITDDPEDRTRLSKYRFFLAFGGQFFIGLITLPLVRSLGNGTNNDPFGWKVTMAILGVIAMGLLLFTFFSTKERISTPTKEKQEPLTDDLLALLKNRGWIILFIAAFFNLFNVAIRNGSIIYYFNDYVLEGGKAVVSLQCANIPEFFANNTLSPIHGIILVAAGLIYLRTHSRDVAIFRPVTGLGAMVIGLVLLGLYYVPSNWSFDFDRTSLFFVSGTLALMAGTLCANLLSSHFSKKTIMIVLTITVSFLLAGFYFIPPENYKTMLVVNILTSFLAGPTPVIVYTMYADVADYTEWKTEKNVMALVFGTIMIAIKGGLTIGAALQLSFLGYLGYDATLPTQSPEVINGIVMLASLFPALFAFLSGATIILYPITNNILDQMKCELAERKSRQASL